MLALCEVSVSLKYMQNTELKKLLSAKKWWIQPREGNSAVGNSPKIEVVRIAFGALQYAWPSSSIWNQRRQHLLSFFGGGF